MKEILEEYKEQFCDHCKNKQCNHGIVLVNEEKVVDNQIQYITTVKCIDFICEHENRTKKMPSNWQRW